jgi:hypothetical protein
MPPEAGAAALPELASVPWRSRTDRDSLRRRGREWTAYTVVVCSPFVGAGLLLLALEPLSFPAALMAFAHAWAIPLLYASRGARVALPVAADGPRGPEAVAQGLLGDLLGHRARDLQRRTGLAMEHGCLGVWLVGEAGALLVTPGGRRIHCFCVRATDRSLPPSDRIAHLLLALRTDEYGFATVANNAFSGAPWRIRRRLAPAARPALDAARVAARTA